MNIFDGEVGKNKGELNSYGNVCYVLRKRLHTGLTPMVLPVELLVKNNSANPGGVENILNMLVYYAYTVFQPFLPRFGCGLNHFLRVMGDVKLTPGLCNIS